MKQSTLNALANLLDSLVANPNEKTPRLNMNITNRKIAEDIQFVARSLRNGNG